MYRHTASQFERQAVKQTIRRIYIDQETHNQTRRQLNVSLDSTITEDRPEVRHNDRRIDVDGPIYTDRQAITFYLEREADNRVNGFVLANA